MRKKFSAFSICCILVLFIFSAFMIWYLPASSSLLLKTEELKHSLDISRGRENKQQDEYDKAVLELPIVQAELEEKKPLAEKAEETVSLLKSQRNELRKEKEEMEKILSGSEEVSSHE